ncbi:hypothetical protein [Rufibacter roseus]|uniref:DUF922 domain-containing protein n=1 Tax=Rufibacter roseus TaxID=1567108 RepID=A0ABW2DJ76_9BACT|nr:hypothetical protein [Rufibacter roseus]
MLFLLAGCLSFTFLQRSISNTSPSPIALATDKLDFTPNEFYIADVRDERPNTKAIAFLVPTTPPGATPQAVDLEGGTANSIRKYIRASLAHNTQLRPVVMRLKEFKVTETMSLKGRVEGKMEYVVAFEVKREGQLLHLFEYKSGARYDRPAGQAAALEPTLRQAIAESLRYLHRWMALEVKHNEKLAREIKVTFEDFTQNNEPDTLFYDPNRPLNWSDFKGGPVTSGKFAAFIFPGLSSESYAVVKNGVIHVKVTLRVYTLRQLSKVRADSKTAYVLNHEQRHFDIVKLVAEHYKQRVQPQKLTLQDYDSMIKYQYLEALWELDQLQKQYDEETHHGLNHTAQERWNRKIQDELQSFM